MTWLAALDQFYVKARYGLIAALFMFLTVTSVFAMPSKSCRKLMLGLPSTKSRETWQQVSLDPFENHRANAPHFWNWALQNQALWPAELLVPGLVIGDGHILNINVVPTLTGPQFSVVDFDDGGMAPFILDFSRYVLLNQVSPYKLDIKDLLAAYQQGLAGKATPQPNIITRALNLSPLEIQKIQDKYISKNTDGLKFDYKKADLTSINEASDEIKSIFKEDSAYFLANLKGHKILDIATRIKTEGGSRGLARFWYLSESNGQLQITEFKLFSTAATDYYQDQKETSVRVQETLNVYGHLDQRFAIAPASGGRAYWMRPRLKSLLDFEPKNLGEDFTLQDAQEASLYFANWMGLRHGAQGSAKSYVQVLQAQEESALRSLQNFLTQYLNSLPKN